MNKVAKTTWVTIAAVIVIIVAAYLLMR